MFIVAAIGFIMGAVVGSFLNVVVWRVPRGMSLVHPPSTCPKCGHRIRPWENIPIISWICLGARCSSCRLPISWKYPAGETAVGILYALISVRVWQAALPLSTLIGWWWFAGTMLSLARIDLQHRIIPNLVTYTGMIAATVLAVIFPFSRPSVLLPHDPQFGGILIGRILDKILASSLPEAIAPRLAALVDCLAGLILGALILGAVYYFGGKILTLWRKNRKGDALPEEAIGRGDIKMLAMTGAFLGPDAVVYLLAGGALLGFIGGLVMLAKPNRRKNTTLSEVPFAPFFAIPALLWVTVGNWFYILFKICSNDF